MWPAFQNMIINIAHHNERGTANSTILTSWDLGLGLGILLGGIIAEHFGYDSTFWMMATVHIVGTIGYIGFTMRKFTLLSASFSSTSESSSATQK